MRNDTPWDINQRCEVLAEKLVNASDSIERAEALLQYQIAVESRAHQMRPDFSRHIANLKARRDRRRAYRLPEPPRPEAKEGKVWSIFRSLHLIT
jgi:hypothetical protein